MPLGVLSAGLPVLPDVSCSRREYEKDRDRLIHEVTDKLGFPVFVAVLSAAYSRVMNGVFYGGTTLLGSLTSIACGNPDRVRELAACSGEERFYTATGFAERMTGDHQGEVYEFLDAETAAALLFGITRLRRAI